VSVAVVTGLFFAFAIAKVVQAQKQQAVTGVEGLIGQVALARTGLAPQGTVFVKGELWDATAEDGPIETGQEVEILAVDGFCLRVKRASPE